MLAIFTLQDGRRTVKIKQNIPLSTRESRSEERDDGKEMISPIPVAL